MGKLPGRVAVFANWSSTQALEVALQNSAILSGILAFGIGAIGCDVGFEAGRQTGYPKAQGGQYQDSWPLLDFILLQRALFGIGVHQGFLARRREAAIVKSAPGVDANRKIKA